MPFPSRKDGKCLGFGDGNDRNFLSDDRICVGHVECSGWGAGSPGETEEPGSEGWNRQTHKRVSSSVPLCPHKHSTLGSVSRLAPCRPPSLDGEGMIALGVSRGPKMQV